MCERVRVCGYAQLRVNARALNGERGEVRGRLCASAQVRDALCVKSKVSQAPTRVRIVTGCGCGSETGNFVCLGTNLVWGRCTSIECLEQRILALRTNPS